MKENTLSWQWSLKDCQTSEHELAKQFGDRLMVTNRTLKTAWIRCGEEATATQERNILVLKEQSNMGVCARNAVAEEVWRLL